MNDCVGLDRLLKLTMSDNVAAHVLFKLNMQNQSLSAEIK